MARISKLEAVQNVRSPLDEGNAGQVSQSGHAALVEFEIRGEADDAADKIDPVLAAVDDAQQAHPQFFIGEFGYASAAKAVDDRRRGRSGQGRGAVASDHARHPRDRASGRSSPPAFRCCSL